MTQALYRRYRPETFQEVIGQDHVIQPLMAALAAGKTTHAYLFSGPRGCGKTTSARILARCLNCADYPTDTPCGECDSCRELARDGSGSLDVVELDAASHGGVDDARELREQAGFAPVRDRFKIYIIDEAHMVSNQGFNALLKLVEEPPPHVKFIFATTEPEKVIGTIRSRTHHYPFRLVPPNTLEEYLEQLCAEERVAAGKDVLALAVRAGTGSVRDTLSVLDQLIGGSDGNAIEYERAVALLGYTSAHLLDDAVTAIAKSSGAELFAVVDSVVRSGHDPRRFVEDLLQRLRDLVIIALAGDSVKDVFLSVPEDQYALMIQQADALGAARASECADLVNEALTKMVGATAPRMQLELLCARLVVASESGLRRGSILGEAASHSGAFRNSASDSPASHSAPSHIAVPSTSGVQGIDPRASEAQHADEHAEAKQSSAARDAMPKVTPIQDPRSRPMPSFMPPQSAQKQQPSEPQLQPPSGSQLQPSAPQPQPPAATQAPASPDSPLHAIQTQWAQIVHAASGESRIVANMLKHATGPLAYNDGTVTVGFVNEGTAAGFNHQRKAHDALAHAIQQAVGVAVAVEGRVGEPAPDAGPKVDCADENLQRNEPIKEQSHRAHLSDDDASEPFSFSEELPPEEDPIYEIPRGDQADADPAGVLAGLIDGTATIRDGRADKENIKSTESAASVKNAAPLPSDPPPFYTQDLPAPPPAELPESLAARYGAQKPQPPAEDSASEPEPEFENPWDEVSDDDPEISQSSLVGVEVALRVLGGTVTEEIPR